MQKLKRLNTLPYSMAPQIQRLSSTAVYPPCPPTSLEQLEAYEPGHGGYTALRYATA